MTEDRALMQPWQIAYEAWEDSPEEYGETLYGSPVERAFRAAFLAGRADRIDALEAENERLVAAEQERERLAALIRARTIELKFPAHDEYNGLVIVTKPRPCAVDSWYVTTETGREIIIGPAEYLAAFPMRRPLPASPAGAESTGEGWLARDIERVAARVAEFEGTAPPPPPAIREDVGALVAEARTWPPQSSAGEFIHRLANAIEALEREVGDPR